MKKVNAAEFRKFLRDYPRKLEVDVSAVGDPQLITFNDFKRAPFWPDSVVAKECGDNYAVLEDINAPVVSSYVPDIEELRDVQGTLVRIGDFIVNKNGIINGVDYTITTHSFFRVVKKNAGTPYERWGVDGIENNIRHWAFEKVDPDDCALGLTTVASYEIQTTEFPGGFGVSLIKQITGFGSGQEWEVEAMERFCKKLDIDASIMEDDRFLFALYGNHFSKEFPSCF